jgi:hypothetical protein
MVREFRKHGEKSEKDTETVIAPFEIGEPTA